jgi:hypothetical protein
MKILNPNQSYTFRKYFEMKIEAKDLAKEFGFSFARRKLNLNQYQGKLDRLEQLKQRIEEILPYVSLANEAARREILISPVIIDLIYYTKSELSIEYQIKVSEQLQGHLDYLIEYQKNFLIVEAKNADLEYGFTQLCAELIALDQWQENQHQTELVGAVTTWNIWQFGQLNRSAKHIEQGLELFRVPEDLDFLMRILVQALMYNEGE